MKVQSNQTAGLMLF